MTAVPSAGYVFDSWSGQTEVIGDIHQNPVSFQMGDDTDNDRVLTANFIPSNLHYTVAATVEPSGGGEVVLQPGQGPDGYEVNRTIYVSAQAHTGYVFVRWNGAILGRDNPRTLLVSENRSITAIFNPTVTAYSSPPGGGSIALTPANSSSGYADGTEVTMTATPARGYRFVSWEGDASGSASSIAVIVDAPKTITAKFAGQSASRWWLWVILGIVGLFGVLVISRLLYARMNRGFADEPYQPDD
jgi:uncharacterized repeat protein (TIGR02543 family)